MSRLRTNENPKNYSGLFLPVIIAIIVVILVIRAFFGGNGETSQNQNSGFVNVVPNQEKSEINIYMSGDTPHPIDGLTKMYSTDSKMEVVSGEAKITLEGNNTKIYVNKLGELKYDGKSDSKENFTINNGDIWVETDANPIKFNLRNFTINSLGNSVFSFSQNLMASTIYVLKGEIDLTPTSEKTDVSSIKIGVGQKLTILNSELSGENFKPEDKIEPIDDIFKEMDFYTKHNGSSYLNSPLTSESQTGSESLSGSSSKGQKAIIFTYPEDEATVDSNTINIEGKLSSSLVEKVTLDDKEVSINKEEKTFIAKDFALDQSINNIAFKAYDKDNNILAKGLLVVYTTSKEKAKEEQEKPTVTTYPLSSKDFSIVSPNENPFKTTENLVKISGYVNKGAVKFITINDFRLTKFSQYSSSWFYFANKDYGTMNDGINLYTIKYYGKEDELLYTSLFTIVKEPSGSESATTTGSGNTTNSGSSSNG